MPRAVNATAIPFQACPAYLGRWRCSVQEKIVLTALGQGFEEGVCEFPEGGSFLEMGGNNGLHEPAAWRRIWLERVPHRGKPAAVSGLGAATAQMRLG